MVSDFFFFLNGKPGLRLVQFSPKLKDGYAHFNMYIFHL